MDKKLKSMSISGAGFAISGIGGAVYSLLKNGFKPDIVSGVSSGSILTFVVCAAKNPCKVIEENAIGFKSSQVFKHPPFNKKGKITLRSIWNAITKNYLSKQDRLNDLLKTFVSENEWNEYINNPNSPIGIVMSVDLLTGAREFVNIKTLGYNEAIEQVLASSSIPVFVKPVETKGKILVDGGIRNHILTEWILDNYNIDHAISIYSRREDFKKYIDKSKVSNTYEVLARTIQIMEYEISKSDADIAELKAMKDKITHDSIFIENILDSVYDADLDKQQKLFDLGQLEAQKIKL